MTRRPPRERGYSRAFSLVTLLEKEIVVSGGFLYTKIDLGAYPQVVKAYSYWEK
jgi:hypothetical protein